MKKHTLLLIIINLLFSLKSFAQFTESNLPIFVIDTKGQSIVDNPKKLVQLQVIWDSTGKVNKISEKKYHYNAFAGIELRGSSSQSFPKKPYSIELRTDKDIENPVSLCGFPKESDYVLFASYSEKSFMHNVLTYNLGRLMGGYSSRTKFVELVLNNEYQGLYILLEKIKVDKNRLDIADLKPTESSGDQLTGGYIIKIDKTTGSNLGTFRSNFPNRNGKANEYIYHAPKTITVAQKDYIRNYIRNFEDAIYTKSLSDTIKGYRAFIDVPSFYKMFILNEISRNIDGYRISSYFHKDKDSKSKKLFAGPPWDYDITYGNADYCQGKRSDLWAYKFNDICSGDNWQVPTFWDKLVSDNYFIKNLREYYFKERKKGGILDKEKLFSDIDVWAKEIDQAQNRNFVKWNILGKYVWPNPAPIPTSFTGEIREMKDWLDARLIWLDQNMPEEFILLNSKEPLVPNITVFPNPFIDKIQIRFETANAEQVSVAVTDMLGKRLFSKSLKSEQGINEFEIPLNDPINQLVTVSLTTSSGKYHFAKAVKLK